MIKLMIKLMIILREVMKKFEGFGISSGTWGNINYGGRNVGYVP